MDLSVLVTYHREGNFAFPSILNIKKMIETLPPNVNCEVLFALDMADEFTTKLVKRTNSVRAEIHETKFGNPGEARNFLISKARGNFLAILDGDDMWSFDWLEKGLSLAAKNPDLIIHPQFAYYFFDSDFNLLNTPGKPSSSNKSHLVQYFASDEDSLSKIRLVNLWTAHCIGSKHVFDRFPYKPNRRDLGLGIEDWSWNIETVEAGVNHTVAEGCVHAIRVKEVGSINDLNFRLGTLPWIHA